jgi:anti-sigma factor RsiW
MSRYLDGSLPPDDVARLNGQLKSNAALRTEFAELLLLDVQLSELGCDARATARSADGLVRTHQTDR